MRGFVGNRAAKLCAATLVVVAVAGALAVTSMGHSQSSPAFRAAALRALRSELRRAIAPARWVQGVRPTPAVGAAVTSAQSYNWAGYADTSTTAGAFTAVSGSWVVPAVTCTPEDRLVAQWVGLDGANTSTVEQTGTLAQCFEGTATYYTWYEMYPAGSVTVGSTVKPGDHITASITRTGSSYKLKLTDATTSGNNVNVTKTCSTSTCLDESAEWVAERPSYSTGIVPLAQFTSWSLTSGSETASGKKGNIASVGPLQIDMIDSTATYNLATPSALNSADNAFSVAWDNSY